MRSPLPAPAGDTADRPSTDSHALENWLDTLEPFCIDWELIWPM